MILPILITLLMGIIAYIIFILAQHKKEIWDMIMFKEGDEDERSRELNSNERENEGRTKGNRY